MVVVMSSKIKLWQIDKDDKPFEVDTETFDVSNLEDRLESWIERNPSILGEELLIINRQYKFPNGEKVDLLGIDADGNLAIIELKRDKGRREAIAQVLDYETSLANLKEEELNEIAVTYFEENKLEWESLREAFEEEFGKRDVAFNSSRRTFIIAPKLEANTERVINYLSSQYGIDINAVTFAYYKDEMDREFIIRNVVVSPEERRERTERTYPLSYHLEQAKTKKVRELYESIFEYFKKQGYRLHSTKYYISLFLDDLEIGYIRPRRTMAHINLTVDYYKEEDIDRLLQLSRKDKHFKIEYDTEWVTKDNRKIVSRIRLRELDLKTFQKYDDEIRKAVGSFVDYEEHYEELEKERKQISK